MIATVSLINICHHIQFQKLFLLMRAFKICSFNNIQICNTVLLTIVTMLYITFLAFPGGTSGKEPACQRRRRKRHRFDPWVRKIPWRKASHGQRSLVGYSPWGHKEGPHVPMSMRTRLKWLTTHACILYPYDLFFTAHGLPLPPCPRCTPDLCSGNQSVLCICELFFSLLYCLFCF